MKLGPNGSNGPKGSNAPIRAKHPNLGHTTLTDADIGAIGPNRVISVNASRGVPPEGRSPHSPGPIATNDSLATNAVNGGIRCEGSLARRDDTCQMRNFEGVRRESWALLARAFPRWGQQRQVAVPVVPP